ncbi:FeoB-associated Cys-rich membrane protein [Clostridium septicum]|uniref:FeoB-associated Cys-rich membrane protein n=1 Tax=Clostridium septicum TaxID=1504 RepID=A0A9N7PI23_CLOSE|nr:FeoB-associated Cys-rich membrane protein [Clostridium septicum]AYE33315.1 FeoB-associated Cys-rich membrane protein [Clostridium septicum]MDU1314448.1 FeoB-associated Cys-rich membrane protein [Clostridium septicum]QAS61485.1 FeoB-associated Cys-rich membrane protein [Clostridium septicum]UEC22078.1 FeoB-associated Cys-rich membrane protein [Clostridium septicum]USR99890.1 FeoB-associated Cys-rich membrane protein [Clostridium septicum]
MEIVITVAIIGFSAYIIYKNVRKSSKGGCNCGNCSSHCPMYNDKNKGRK